MSHKPPVRTLNEFSNKRSNNTYNIASPQNIFKRKYRLLINRQWRGLHFTLHIIKMLSVLFFANVSVVYTGLSRYLFTKETRKTTYKKYRTVKFIK